MASSGNFERDTIAILNEEKQESAPENFNVQQPTIPSAPPPPQYVDSPPPYSEQPPQQPPIIACQVCHSPINIARKTGRVAECPSCHECTAIKPALPGKKYYRCPCNCLLTCNATATKVSCPRDNCRKILMVGNTSLPSVPTAVARTDQGRYRCVHCNQIFLFSTVRTHLAQCPHCHRVSSAGGSAARIRAIVFLIIALIFLGAGVGVTVGTLELASRYGGYYAIWIGAYVFAITCFARSIYFFTIKVSPLASN